MGAFVVAGVPFFMSPADETRRLSHDPRRSRQTGRWPFSDAAGTHGVVRQRRSAALAVPHLLADEPGIGINGLLRESRVRCRTAREKRWLPWSPSGSPQPTLQRGHRSVEHLWF